MFYKIGKNIFYFLINFLHFIQVSLVFLAFFTTFYWLLQLGQVPFIQGVAPFFESIKDFVHIFYTRRVTIDAMTVDFSFLLATFAMLLTSWWLNPIIDFLKATEKNYDSTYKKFKKKTEELFNSNLEIAYKGAERKNNKFLFLIKFKAKNSGKDEFFNKDFEAGLIEKQKEALLSFCHNISGTMVFQKKFVEDNVLLYFDDFNKIDTVISILNKAINTLKNEFRAQKWEISFFASVETFSKNKEILDKCKNMMSLIKLNLKDEITCLSTFKSRYLLLSNPKNHIESQGIYKIKNEEEVFCIKAHALNRKKYNE